MPTELPTTFEPQTQPPRTLGKLLSAVPVPFSLTREPIAQGKVGYVERGQLGARGVWPILAIAAIVHIFTIVAFAARRIDPWLFMFLAAGSLFFGGVAALAIWVSKRWRGVAFDGKNVWLFRGRGERVQAMRTVPVEECQLSIHPVELEILGMRGMARNGSALILWIGEEWMTLACAWKLEELSDAAQSASERFGISVTPGGPFAAKAGIRL